MNTHITRCALALALATGAIASHTGTAAAAGLAHLDSELSGGTLYFTAAGGKNNKVTLSVTSTRVIIRDDADLIASPDCETSWNVVSCPLSAVKRVVVGLDDGDDTFQTSVPVWLPLEVAGHDGNDVLRGGWRNDKLLGGAGTDTLSGDYGADELQGGTGNDGLDGGPGDDPFGGEFFPAQTDRGDKLVGGSGLDQADYSTHQTGVTVRLDGEAEDGAAGERDSVASDIERVVGSDHADALHLTAGTSGTLEGGGGNDLLVGSWAADTLDGGHGNDYIPAFDGQRDTVKCGAGTLDEAVVDTSDIVTGCETVRRP
jgi:RTX calcium-binding nonapeptide repeat (4 copies)